jgi:hypothetical protein
VLIASCCRPFVRLVNRRLRTTECARLLPRRMLALMLTSGRVLLLGLGAVVVFIALAEAFARMAHASLVGSIVIGKDNRTSTSKVFVLMWTFLVAWSLASLFFAGEVASQRPCTEALNPTTGQNDLVKAAAQCEQVTGGRDRVGLLQIGWANFIASGLDGGYLILLGIPAGAAVAAKAITQSQVDSGSSAKTSAPQDDQTVATRVAQIFSSDDGSTDLADFQYMFFNLLAAAYFVAQVLKVTAGGLPHIPDTLLGLTSVSAALYVGNKAANRSKPTILSVFPGILTAGQGFTITGTDLTSDPSVPPAKQPPGLISPQVTINGTPALNATADPVVADRLTATVPNGLIAAGVATPIPGTVEVLSAYGFKTDGYQVQLK